MRKAGGSPLSPCGRGWRRSRRVRGTGTALMLAIFALPLLAATPAAAEATRAEARALEAQLREADDLIATAFMVFDRATMLKQYARLNRLSGDFPSSAFEAYGTCRVAAAALSTVAIAFTGNINAQSLRSIKALIDDYDEALIECDRSIGRNYQMGPLKALRDAP
jgi:hypothetical protein